ncbi:MAG TPA: potassium-transporting ATPase subunit KdpC [Burkholderiales bacterium]|nr:potassium-transporting ATPase subunit KdpC [Burkholderiales bacterium]
MLSLLRPAFTLFVLLSLLTGIAYPLAVTGVAMLAFPQAAGGSLVFRDGRPVGSELIGQNFADPRYFWGRPSATLPMPYNGAASGGSNQGPANPALAAAVRRRIEALRAADPGNALPVPVDLVTASASGLDPDISTAGAEYQAPRVAAARSLRPDQVLALVAQHAQRRRVGFLGESRVNVLRLNLALDALQP